MVVTVCLSFDFRVTQFQYRIKARLIRIDNKKVVKYSHFYHLHNYLLMYREIPPELQEKEKKNRRKSQLVRSPSLSRFHSSSGYPWFSCICVNKRHWYKFNRNDGLGVYWRGLGWCLEFSLLLIVQLSAGDDESKRSSSPKKRRDCTSVVSLVFLIYLSESNKSNSSAHRSRRFYVETSCVDAFASRSGTICRSILVSLFRKMMWITNVMWKSSSLSWAHFSRNMTPKFPN